MIITKNMQESEFVYEILANKALKGFILKDGRVVPKMALTLEDNKAIDSFLKRVCGHNINYWLQNLDINKWMEKPIGQIDIADIVPSSIIKLGLSHKETLEIVYQGNFEFFVYNDSIGVLHPLDILKALSLSFETGEVTYFKVFRDGNPFPNDKMLFKGDVKHITLINTDIEGCYVSSKKNVEPVISMKTVFAWQASKHPARFVEDHLTYNSQAIFILDLIKNEYSINPQFSKNCYNDDVTMILGHACKIIHTGNGLQTIVPGKFSLEPGVKNYSFYIREKAEVGL